MALGTIASNAAVGQEGSNIIIHNLTFLGDDAYAAGGTAGFQASVQAALGKGSVEVMGVVAQDCGDNVPVYDKANDKLKVFVMSTGVELGNGDHSADTYNLLVICK